MDCCLFWTGYIGDVMLIIIIMMLSGITACKIGGGFELFSSIFKNWLGNGMVRGVPSSLLYSQSLLISLWAG